ncbi:MAG: serine/threonine protein kinase [Planctomycetes bacterium]|nr:serine/threonine protein kinase [Planctomycetota bacterium]
MSRGTFEQILLSLAVRHKLMTREAAGACLKEFGAQPSEGPALSIVQLVLRRGLVTPEQAAALESAARKILTAQETQRIDVAPAKGAPRPAPTPGDPVPGYKILGKVGSGGTSTVFLAEDVKHQGRKVALKILHPSKAKDPKSLDRFHRESRLLVQMSHPNLVKGYEHGRAGPLVYLAMEYLDGETVQDVLEREKGVSEARALEIILKTAEVLEYVHRQGIVHRDIKPGNVMITSSKRIKLCDLGFSQPVGRASDREEWTTSGTVQYMSPEQAQGSADLDARADIYSLGATLYHMVMGEVPFSGTDSLDVMAKQVMEALNSTEIKNRRISRHMHYFIERMMSKDKTLRYADTRELIDDINAQIEGLRSLEYRPERDEASGILKQLRGPSRGPASIDGGASTRRLRPPSRRSGPPK